MEVNRGSQGLHKSSAFHCISPLPVILPNFSKEWCIQNSFKPPEMVDDLDREQNITKKLNDRSPVNITEKRSQLRIRFVESGEKSA